MFIADNKYAAFSDCKDDLKCGPYEVMPFVTEYKEQHYLFWQGEIKTIKDTERYMLGLMMNKHGVFFHCKIDQTTQSVMLHIPAIKNRTLSLCSVDSEEGRFQVGIMERALRYHGWSVKDLFDNFRNCGTSYLTQCFTIDELKKRLEKVNESDINFHLN
ncbi:hypothetical protein AVA65_07765 [Salmonella enterica subsp. enterica serovar Minnesota]|nr:hypothetical protein [Salmonella enterica subsp. enterica serovar Minnesota]